MVELEEKHPLGRLFDLDVIAPDGIPVSRQEVALPLVAVCFVQTKHAFACVTARIPMPKFWNTSNV